MLFYGPLESDATGIKEIQIPDIPTRPNPHPIPPAPALLLLRRGCLRLFIVYMITARLFL